MPLDSNLGALLERASSGYIMPPEDNTILELGMNTVSHELRSGSGNRHIP